MEPQSGQPSLIVTAVGSEHSTYLISPSGVFSLPSSTTSTSEQPPRSSQKRSSLRKVLDSSKKLYIRIIKSQTHGLQHKFIVRISQQHQSKDLNVSGVSDLEKIFSILGHSAHIVGLQEIVISFKKIGEGAFAQVFQAITRYGSKFALKSFPTKTLEDSKNKAAFYNEINILKQLKSPYIIPFDYLFKTDKAFYLKMEYLTLTLKQKMSEKLLIRQQKELMRQLMTALVEMKRVNVIHRDLKPENIMVRVKEDGSEECILIDFGLATKADEKEYLFVRCGTPGFLAPQIANCASKKERQSCAVDMFSLGCIFFKMYKITGHHLFGGKNAKDILQNNKKNKYNSPFFSKLSENQNSLLTKMTEINPIKRITPQDALKQPYFQSDVDDVDEIPQEQCTLNQHLKKISSQNQTKSMESVNSFCSSMLFDSSCTSQAYRGLGRDSLQDSCLTFQLGINLSGVQEESILRISQSKKKSTKNRPSFSKSPSKKSHKASRFSKMEPDFSKIV